MKRSVFDVIKTKIINEKDELVGWIKKNIHFNDVSIKTISFKFDREESEVLDLIETYNEITLAKTRSKLLTEWLKKFYVDTDLDTKEIATRFGFKVNTVYKKNRKLNLYKRGTYAPRVKKEIEVKDNSNVKEDSNIKDYPKEKIENFKNQSEYKKKRQKRSLVRIDKDNKRHMIFKSGLRFNKITLSAREQMRKEFTDLYFFLYKNYYGKESVKEISDKFNASESVVKSIMEELNVAGFYKHSFSPKQIKYLRTEFKNNLESVDEVLKMKLFKNITKKDFNKFLNTF